MGQTGARWGRAWEFQGPGVGWGGGTPWWSRVRILRFHCRGLGSMTGWGTKVCGVPKNLKTKKKS